MAIAPNIEVKNLSFREFAPAKINLHLHILGKREDGYHDLESLVTFADFGDYISFFPGGNIFSLDVKLNNSGETLNCGNNESNLVLKAAWAFKNEFQEAPFGHFVLEKNIPIAAGLGGGSADAAATLRLLARISGISVHDEKIVMIAQQLGADVPVCLESQPRYMRGIGHELSEKLSLPAFYALLVNPNLQTPTPEIFKRLKKHDFSGKTDISLESISCFFNETRNDLTRPALDFAPPLEELLASFKKTKPLIARISGSGATCFALYPDFRSRQLAQMEIEQQFFEYWLKPVVLNAQLFAKI